MKLITPYQNLNQVSVFAKVVNEPESHRLFIDFFVITICGVIAWTRC